MPQSAIKKTLRRFGTAKLRNFFRELGPGRMTGAADDDASGISTYSVTCAQFGYGRLWTALFSFPLMAAVQLMCARLGMVTGQGLAGVVRRRYSAPILWGACALLVIANTFNIGADLGGMAEVAQMITGVSRFVWLPLFTVLIVVLLVWFSYKHIVNVFKWLTLVLFAYVIAAFLAHPRWGAVLKATFIPQIRFDAAYLATFLGVLGTTISPYLFFWQAAQEVEEERKIGRKTVHARRGASDEELAVARTDVLTGMAFSNVTMYFIIRTTGATLYGSGQRDIETARQAAEALRPLAGSAAYLLFTLGLIGTGMLGVPVLAGSAAYAVSESMHWRGSLDDRPRRAPKFYAVLATAMARGLVLDFLKFNPLRVLAWFSALNASLAPPLVALVTLLSSDKKVMESRLSSPLLQILGWLTAAIMSAATVVMIVMWFRS